MKVIVLHHQVNCILSIHGVAGHIILKVVVTGVNLPFLFVTIFLQMPESTWPMKMITSNICKAYLPSCPIISLRKMALTNWITIPYFGLPAIKKQFVRIWFVSASLVVQHNQSVSQTLSSRIFIKLYLLEGLTLRQKTIRDKCQKMNVKSVSRNFVKGNSPFFIVLRQWNLA